MRVCACPRAAVAVVAVVAIAGIMSGEQGVGQGAVRLVCACSTPPLMRTHATLRTPACTAAAQA
jgi:hypothetical protein